MAFNKLIKCLVATLLSIFISTASGTQFGDFEIKRFDKVLSSIADGISCDTTEVFQDYDDVIDSFVIPLMGDTALSKSAKLKTFENLRNIKFFYDVVNSVFASTDKLQMEVDSINIRFEREFKKVFPRITTIISPYNQSVVMLNDTSIAVALNHYLGRDYPPYSYYPNYIRDFKTPEKIPYNLTEAALRVLFAYEQRESTLLEHIVYEGAIAYAASVIIPQFSECLYFSFSTAQEEWAKASHAKAWQKLKEAGALTSTDVYLQRSMLATAPFSSAISPESPGGIGKWFGLQIVRMYIERHGTTIHKFLTDKIYQHSNTILKQSKYGNN